MRLQDDDTIEALEQDLRALNLKVNQFEIQMPKNKN
jgi:hypothetical protein